MGGGEGRGGGEGEDTKTWGETREKKQQHKLLCFGTPHLTSSAKREKAKSLRRNLNAV